MGNFSSKLDQIIYIWYNFYSEKSKFLKFVIFPKLVKIYIFNEKQTRT